VADRLVVWLHGTAVAVLTPAPEFRIRMEWHADGIERWGLGNPALSVGLPVGTPTGPRDMRGLDFFENMLPEGPALARMAALARVRPADTYGILASFGRDCAGAVVLLPDGEQHGTQSRGGYTPMTPGDLRQVISDLDAAPLGAAPERGFRPSLPGFQRKALLGRAPDGTWQLPNGDAPSTWILKPRAVALAVGLKDAVAQFLSATPSTGIELTGVGHGPFDKMGLICPTLGP
jgi:serine/threonine-protein kinase HipA